MMMMELFDFAGPFDEATSLGHAEINFIKSNISDLADIWIPLDGNLALASQAKLHLRIFLNNSRGSSSVKDYLNKMEKEVGKKVYEEFSYTHYFCFLKPFFHSLTDFLSLCKYVVVKHAFSSDKFSVSKIIWAAT